MKKITLNFKDVSVVMEVEDLQIARMQGRIIYGADKNLGKSNY